MQSTKLAGIPTKYRGVQFRSRLEARWAVFFDLVGWKWDYEPLDLPGWIPDFVLHKPNRKRWLAEIKPHYDLDRDVVAKVLAAWRAGNRTENILLLGIGVGWLRSDAWYEFQLDEIYADQWAAAGNRTQWRRPL